MIPILAHHAPSISSSHAIEVLGIEIRGSPIIDAYKLRIIEVTKMVNTSSEASRACLVVGEGDTIRSKFLSSILCLNLA
jgi:hypothetical protein